MGRHERRAQAKAQERLLRRANREDAVFEFQYPRGALIQGGPIMNTFLAVTDAHADALRAGGLAVPDPVRCRFLLDTGADMSVVRHDIAEKAGLKLISSDVPLHGVGVDTTGRSYMGRIVFIYESKFADGVVMNIAVDTTVMSAKLESDRIDGLIGRDVLAHFDFSYNGSTGLVKLKYIKPPEQHKQ